MRREALQWWEQAKADLETAQANLKTGRYYACAFFSQQAAEKALKALFIEKRRRLSSKTHDLLQLGESLSLPPELMASLRRINPAYLTARYPNAANSIPALAFDEDMARAHLQDATRALQWVEKGLV